MSKLLEQAIEKVRELPERGEVIPLDQWRHDMELGTH
jgi:hypothetical protein